MKKLFFLLALALNFPNLYAQSYQVPLSGSTSVNACGGVVYDNGGTGNYGNNATGKLTINPVTAGSYVLLSFTSFNVQTCCDRLYIYDGTSTAAPLIGTYTSSPGNIYATNSTGALTLKFTSDASTVYSGFEAAVSCIQSIPQPDLIVETATLPVNNVAPGTSMLVNYITTNQGSISSVASETGFYLSADSDLDAGDLFLSSKPEIAVAPGSSASNTKSVIIPSLSPVGNYYLLVTSDYNALVNESMESNNVHAVPFTISASIVDLYISSNLLSASTVTSGSTVTSSGYLNNLGNMPVSSTSLNFYLSSNLTYDASDVSLGSLSSILVNPGYSYSFSKLLTIPVGTVSGNYYILVIADQADVVVETEEQNNTNGKSIVVSGSERDFLLVSQGLTQNTVAPGSNVQLNYSPLNVSGLSLLTQIAFYLSTDSIFDLSDTYLSYTSSTLLPNSLNPASISLTVPSATTAGNYYLLSFVDYTNSQSETNENNNVQATPLFVVTTNPVVDLRVLTPYLSIASLTAGTSVTANCSVENSGNVTASSSNVAYYLSTDPLFDASDVYLNYSSGLTLGATTMSSRSSSLVIPVGTAPGTYYVLYFADYTNQLVESDETNNLKYMQLTVNVPFSDLSVQTPSSSLSSIAVGATVSVYAYVCNGGNSSCSSSNIAYYLSSDVVFDAGDVYLNSVTGGVINPNSSSYRSTSATIPAATVPGTYYILFYTDYTNLVSESNETNNVNYIQVTVNALYIDLVVQNATLASSQIPVGGSVYASSTIINYGNSVASTSKVAYYLSGDGLFDAGDVFLGFAPGSTLNGGASATRSLTLTLPAGTLTGNYYILYYADYSGQVIESDETNNIEYLQVSVVNPFLDLIVQSPTLSLTSIPLGNTASATCYIYNNGNIGSASSNVAYYLSADLIFDATDVYLNSSTGGFLTGGSSSYRSASLTIPNATVPGNYYILYYTDYSNQETESSETNNVNYLPVSIVNGYIDLLIVNPTLSVSTVSAGGSVTAYGYIKNAGNISSSSSNIGYYLSTDAFFDASDVYLNSAIGGALSATVSSYMSKTLTIPLGTATGSYFVLYFADYTNLVSESIESNNVLKYPINVGVSGGTTYLVPSTGSNSITACSGVVYDNGGTSNYANSSNGNLTINPGTAGSYILLSFNSFSVESCCDRLYIYDGTSTAAPLIGSYTTNPGNVIATSASGALTLMFTSDGSVAYTGFDASISCVASLPASSLSDLYISGQTLSASSVGSGINVTASFDITNQGLLTASSSNVGFYLSTDTIWNASDVYLTNLTGGSLNISGSATRNRSMTIPVNTPAGNYYILYYADYSALVTESVETNNVRWSALSVYIPVYDFTLNSPFLSSNSLVSGSAFTATCNIVNQGNSTANSSYIGYYLSTDTIWSASDTYLNYYYGSSLAPGVSSNRTVSLTMPNNTLSGNYYILYYADYSGYVSESDETNNFAWSAISVSQQNIDLVMNNTGLSSNVVYPSSVVLASGNIVNQGTNASVYSYVGYYLSTDTTWSALDVYLNYSSGSNLNPGTGSPRSSSLSIPLNTAAGNYYILYYADYASYVNETDETNNIAWEAITISASSIDLVVINPGISSDALVEGASFLTNYTVTNQGLSTTGSSAVGYFLSSDTIRDAGDVLLTSYPTGTLQFGASVGITQNLGIPNGTVAGNYYILFCADYLSAINETNETNNLEWRTLTVVPSTSDLLVLYPSITQNSVVAGSSIATTAYVLNEENKSASTSSIGYYLSADTIWDAGDAYLVASSGGVLGGENILVKNTTLTIPLATTAGNYYILYFVDYLNSVTESSETNNVAYIPLTIVPSTTDLSTIDNYLSLVTVPKGSNVTASCSVLNSGNTSCYSSNIGYYLSVDSLWSAGDVFLAVKTGSTLSANSYVNKNQVLTIPSGTVPGDYYILYYADHTALVNENNESNNVSSTRITVTYATVDLLTLAPFAPNTDINAGSNISIGATLFNTGLVSSTTGNVGFYLSADSLYSASDTYLSSVSVGGLIGISSVQLTASVNIPSTTPTGDYYLLYYADYNHLETENNETNNVNQLKISVVGISVDLTLLNPSLSLPNVMAGSSVFSNCYVFNQGNSNVLSSKAGYYLSGDTLWDGSDINLGFSPGGVLAPGASRYDTSSLLIPSNTVSGNYYILFFADFQNLVFESTETNNLSFVPVTVGLPFVDLVVLSVFASTDTTTAGDVISLSYAVSNNGSASSASSNLGYYLSTDNVWDPSDVYLNSSSGGALMPGGSGNGISSVTIPLSTTSGTYYILYYADYLNAEVENNDNNNVSAIQIEVVSVYPDLVIQTPVLDVSTVLAGSGLIADSYVFNQGSTSAASSNVAYYLSSDTIWNASDVYLSASSGGALAANASNLVSSPLLVPLSTASGNYYILFYADYSNLLSEPDETNNVSYASITVETPYVDLTVSSFNASVNTANPGDLVSLSCDLTNSGNSPSASADVAYYLSTDNTWSPSDVYLNTSSAGALTAGSTSSELSGVTIPLSTAAGTYYILYYVDFLNAEAESNELNNVSALPLSVLVVYPDLIIQNPVLSTDSVLPGNNVLASCSIFNQGDKSATVSSVGFYLSSNLILDVSDVLLNNQTGASLLPDSSSTRAKNLHIPALTSPGTYYILYYADYLGEENESLETNNVSYLTLTVTDPTEKLDELSSGSLISVFPNPANQLVNIVLPESEKNKIKNIRLLDLAGNVIFTGIADPGSNPQLEMEVGGYASGTYLVEIETENAMSIHKLVIQH